MTQRRNPRRLAKRFAVMFALAAGGLGIASLISGGSESDDSSDTAASPAVSSARSAVTTSPATSIPTVTTATTDAPTTTATAIAGTDQAVSTATDGAESSGPPVVVSSLPAPDLASYCIQTSGAGSTPTPVDATWTFSCALDGVPSEPIAVGTVCIDQFGPESRQVTLTAFPRELRCVPTEPVRIGDPDFDAYCKQAHGQTARSTAIAPDEKGWRCAATPNGVFEVYEPSFDRYETDWVCQTSTDAEAFARADEPTFDGWACYAGP